MLHSTDTKKFCLQFVLVLHSMLLSIYEPGWPVFFTSILKFGPMKGLMLILLFLASIAGAQTTYYIDDVAGKDDNPGTLPGRAWASLEKVNETMLEPGDSVCFRRGGSWTGNLIPRGSGTKENKIVFSAYGKGPAPVLDARGAVARGEKASYTIRFFNQEYFELTDLKIKNYKAFEQAVSHTFRENTVYANSEKMGIYVEGRDCGSLHGIAFINLEICYINGSMNTKHNGGIFMEITRGDDPQHHLPSNFTDFQLVNCRIHDVDRTGFSNTSAWWNRSLQSSWGDTLNNGKLHDWFPSTGIIIRNNRFERTGANALIVRVASTPLIEYNLFSHCSVKGSGNASFPFNCDSALFQYNEACYTYFNTEADSWNGRRDADAGGFDSDWNCKNTVIQYNYSHHNGYGGVLICCDGGSPTGFNDGTIIRYNIFQENKHHIVRTSGPVSRTLIHNNLFYSGDTGDPVMMLFHKSWGGFSDSVAYVNNIFYAPGSGNSIQTGKSSRNIFENNLYFGEIANMEDDAGGIHRDPLFYGGAADGTGWKCWPGFLLRKTSPAIDAGKRIQGMPREDYRGVAISGNPDLGPLEHSGEIN